MKAKIAGAFLLFAVLAVGIASTTAPAVAQDCTTWVCERVDGQWRCQWSVPPNCPAHATPVPLPTYVATAVATPGTNPRNLPPSNPLAQPCKQDGYTYDSSTSCLACSSSPYPNVAGTTECQACQSITRQPYPRGLVGVENRFRLYGPTTAQTVQQICTTKANCASTIHRSGVRDVKYYLRWVRASDRHPIWGWDERPWNVANHAAPDTGFGWQTSHTYWTSSFNLVEGCVAGCDKPANGPSLVDGEHLPAYQVRVLVPWYAQYRVTYQVLDYWSKCVRSSNSADCCNGQPDLSSNCTPVIHDPPRIGDHGCYLDWRDCIAAKKATNYEDAICWVNQDTGWKAIDARLFGSDYSYVYGDRAGNEATDLESARCDVAPVPVIEVQGVLDQH